MDRPLAPPAQTGEQEHDVIQAKMQGKNGQEILVYGLSRANMKLLLAGQPIKLDGSALRVQHTTVIVGGETEQDIHEALSMQFGRAQETYTCCAKHAAESGLPHRPPPPGTAGTACPPKADGLPDV